jgi:hypothetical protein
VNRRTTRNDGLKIVPTTTDTTSVLVDQFAQRDGHFFFDGDGVIDMTRDTEQLGTRIVFTTKRGEPVTTAVTKTGGANETIRK